MLPHVRRPRKAGQYVVRNLCGFCITECRRPARGVIYRQHGCGQVAFPGLPAPGFPDMCGCDRAGQAGPVLPTCLHRRQNRGGIILRPDPVRGAVGDDCKDPRQWQRYQPDRGGFPGVVLKQKNRPGRTEYRAEYRENFREFLQTRGDLIATGRPAARTLALLGRNVRIQT